MATLPRAVWSPLVTTTLPDASVSLLNPSAVASAQHDAALGVLMSLAQSSGPSFKVAVAQLAPTRLAVLQASLKKKADADAKEREAEARKEKHKAAAATGKINFANWGGGGGK